MTTKHGERAAAWLADKRTAMEETLAPLVVVNSFTENVRGGNEVGARFRSLFGEVGLDARIERSQVFADHLVFTSTSKTGAPAMALVGHLDTVFPPGVFEGYTLDGELARGPGVLDMKGGLVVVALRAPRARGDRGPRAGRAGAPRHRGGRGGRLAGGAEGHRARHRGASRVPRVRGRARAGRHHHAEEGNGRGHRDRARRRGARGQPARGGHERDLGARRFVDRAQGLTDYARGVTVNVGKVLGGQGKNTVPDRADAWLDLRFCSRADGESSSSRCARRRARRPRRCPGDAHRARRRDRAAPARAHGRERGALPGIRSVRARASGLGDEEAPLIGGGSDASTSSAMGIPSIDGLGPRGKGFHTKDEQIEVASLVPKAQALARFLAGEPPR